MKRIRITRNVVNLHSAHADLKLLLQDVWDIEAENRQILVGSDVPLCEEFHFVPPIMGTLIGFIVVVDLFYEELEPRVYR